MQSRRSFNTAALFFGLGTAALSLARSLQAQSAGEIPKSALLQPAELAALLRTSSKPLILQVGSHQLFNEAHIPNSQYAGPGSSEAGLASLESRLKPLPRTQPIVLYCGCCPWTKCPNIRAAYANAVKLGFTQVKALYIPQDYGTDWVDKGYPSTSVKA